MTTNKDRDCAFSNVIGGKPLGVPTGGGGGGVPDPHQTSHGFSGSDRITNLAPDTIEFNILAPQPAHKKGVIFWDELHQCPAYYNDRSQVLNEIGREAWIRGHNATGVQIDNGTVCTAVSATGGLLNMVPADADNYSLNQPLCVCTEDILDGDDGEFTVFGNVNDINTSSWNAGDTLYLSTTPGQLTNERPGHPAKVVIMGKVLVSDLTIGSIFVLARQDNLDFEFDGCCIERQDTFITTDATEVYFETELIGGGDLPVQLDGAVYLLDCTTGAGVGGRARATLTQGTVGVPEVNFAWVELVATVPTLVSGTIPPTDGRPFAFVGLCAIQDRANVITNGALVHQRTTDAKAHNGRGRFAYVDERLRVTGAIWSTGVQPTASIDTVPDPDLVDLAVTAGEVYQLHRQLFPALSVSVDGCYVANASGLGTLTPYQKITNLATIRETVNGTDLGSQAYNLVVFGCINKTTGECKLFVNLPTDSYVGDTAAYNDADNTAVVSVPVELRSTAFLIARIPLNSSSGGTSFEFINPAGKPEIISLLGNPIGVSGSGASGAASTFSDDIFEVFNNADNTKIIGWDVSPVTTGTKRILGAPNFDMNFPTADGSANQRMITDGAGNLSFADPVSFDYTFRAYLTTGSQTVTNGNEDVVNFDATNYNVGSKFSTANNRFQQGATGAGNWIFSGTVQANFAQAGVAELRVYQNLTQIDQFRLFAPAAGVHTLHVNTPIRIVANDIVELRLFNSSGDDITIQNSGLNFVGTLIYGG